MLKMSPSFKRLGRATVALALVASSAAVIPASSAGAWSTTTPDQATVATFGGSTGDEAYGIAVDSSDNVITVGTFSGTADFDPSNGTTNLTSVGGLWDAYVTKVDSSGELVWAKSFGGSSQDTALSVDIDSAGNIYVTGTFANTVDFDPDSASTFSKTAAGFLDGFILKLNSLGVFQWVRTFGASGQVTQVQDVAVSSTGDVFAVGGFSGTVNFEPDSSAIPYPKNLTAVGSRDFFALKLTTSGAFGWATSAGGIQEDIAQSVALDTTGNVVVAGYFEDTVDFNPDGSAIDNRTATGKDAFVWKLSSSGAFIWSASAGGTGDDGVYAVEVDLSGNIYSTGQFNQFADFNPGVGTLNVVVNGISAAFVWKLNSTGAVEWAHPLDGDGTGPSYGYGLSVDSAGSVLTTGYFKGTSEFDPANVARLTSAGGYDVYIWKLSTNGTYQWAGAVGSSTDSPNGAEEMGRSIVVNSSGDSFIAGKFVGSSDFDPGSGTAARSSVGLSDAFALKLDQLGHSTSSSGNNPTQGQNNNSNSGSNNTNSGSSNTDSNTSSGSSQSSSATTSTLTDAQIAAFRAATLVQGSQVIAGQSYTVTADGFSASETVNGFLKGTSSSVGSASANSVGKASVSIKIPSNASGKKTLYLHGARSGHGVRQTITINKAASVLPETGNNPQLMWWAVAVLTTGIGTVAFSRRRRFL